MSHQGKLKVRVRGLVRAANWLMIAVVGLLAASAAHAQTSEAVSGEPFGVGRLTMNLPPDTGRIAWQTNHLILSERDGRAVYPVFTQGRVLRILGGILGGDSAGQTAPDSLTVLFLFRGDEPLDLTVYTPGPQRFTLPVHRPINPRQSQNLLLRWWREYHAAVREQTERSDYPPVVETYLTAMLGRRLGLNAPLLSRASESSANQPPEMLELLLGVESQRLEQLRQTNATAEVPEAANRPLPDEIAWTPHEFAEPPTDVAIEPLAMRVPPECFYVRFGSFENYLWFDQLQQDYGGDLSRMIRLRGFDAQLTSRMQQQLGLKQSELTKLFGPTVVADLALIGRDLFLRDGAAVGMLFQAKLPLLGANLTAQRAEIAAEWEPQGARLQTLTIAGREVSLLATPDNRLRSFYATDGNFHLVTNSRALVERFVTLRDSRASLGDSVEFRSARTVLPGDRRDTLFAYFSAPFFQGLVSPQYQVELRRRLRAAAEIESVQLARLAAAAERQPADTIEDLVAGGFLPRGFGRRSDGSETVIAGSRVLDSLRGERGHFLPIPDVAIDGVTLRESQACVEQADFYSKNWRQMDPLLIGVKRFALDDRGLERIAIDAWMLPFAAEKYGWLTSVLGPPTRTRVAPAPGDLVTMQAVLKGGLLSPNVPPHHLFLGIQDNHPLTDLRPDSLLKTLMMVRTTPGYLGAWPKPGFLDLLPWGLGGGPPDVQGFSQLPLGIWRRQWADYSVVAFDPNLLANVTPQLRVEETEDAAQVRLHIGDLSNAKLQTLVNQLSYNRAWQASLGNTRLLHILTQQLQVPRNEALAVAEQLLDAKLRCTLDGDYTLNAIAEGADGWTSSRWNSTAASAMPDDYRAPLLDWFRGAEAGLTMPGDHLVLHATLDMQRKPAEQPAAPLPRFDLFGGFGTGLGRKQPAADTKPPRPAADNATKKPPREF